MICSLRITVQEKQGRSYLKDVFVTPPFRVVPVGQHKSDQSSYLMVMSTSPGILSGDEYQIDIQVKENARLQLQSQSYQRLYNMEKSATQHMKVRLEKGSSFFYVPHPVVPHENSCFTSVNQVYLHDHCELMMSEIITCGRKHHGEVFKYRHFQNLIEIYHHQKLILKDNVLLQPALMPLNSTGLLEGYTHQGTLIYISTSKEPGNESNESVHDKAPSFREKEKSVQELIEYLFLMMETETDIIFGISAVQQNGFVLRILGNGGEQLYNSFQKVQQVIWAQTYQATI
ncbi:urease accessory protein [Pedobacter cryoconitis]|uniref:Urease accessory protein UreD n=1 Tax=Pedobacter cryoconitis TaxID=188932 RepID=A0A7W8ZQQ7_9SPHI|nr:urease accessory protein UreD [Pedobacter cryoconitis]MBB5638426.1 urease accessory protein [Pedobacter cryoconitis]